VGLRISLRLLQFLSDYFPDAVVDFFLKFAGKLDHALAQAKRHNHRHNGDDGDGQMENV